MTQSHDLFARCPSLLRLPSWLGAGVHEDRELPFEPGDNKTMPGDRWIVTPVKTGETIYSDIGPVEVVRA